MTRIILPLLLALTLLSTLHAQLPTETTPDEFDIVEYPRLFAVDVSTVRVVDLPEDVSLDYSIGISLDYIFQQKAYRNAIYEYGIRASYLRVGSNGYIIPKDGREEGEFAKSVFRSENNRATYIDFGIVGRMNFQWFEDKRGWRHYIGAGVNPYYIVSATQSYDRANGTSVDGQDISELINPLAVNGELYFRFQSPQGDCPAFLKQIDLGIRTSALRIAEHFRPMEYFVRFSF